MRSMNRLIIVVGIAVVVLTAFVCTGALAAAQKRGTQPAGAPITPPKASNPQGAETQSSAPAANSAEAPVAETAGQPIEMVGQQVDTAGQPIGADSREMAAPPTIQFSISVSTVNFGGGSLTPQATPYTQPFTTAVNSNIPWRVSVTKDHDLQGAAELIPSSDFSFSAVGPAGGTTYQAPAGTQFGTDVLAVEGTRGSNLTTTITYSLIVPWSIQADSYSATHTYTAMSI